MDTPLEEKKLTMKQRRFLKLYFETGNGVQSALAVFDTKDYSSAGAIASELLKKLKDPIKLLMESNGLSIGDLIETVQEARKADKIITSHTEPDKVVPDHGIRLKAVEIASRWLGVEQPTITLQQNQQNNFFPISDQQQQERQEFNNYFKDFLKQLPVDKI